MPKRDPIRKTISVRITKTTAERMKAFLRDYCGKPLYLKPGEFVEKAILREIQRLEMILSGVLPMDDAERTILPRTKVQGRKSQGASRPRSNAVRASHLAHGEDDHQ